MSQLHCLGRIVRGEELTTLRNAALCELERQTIVLNLAGVEAIDAGGLGLLVFLHTCAHGLGSELRIVPSAQVEKTLELTKLTSVLTMCSAAEIDGYLAPPPEDGHWDATRA